MGVTARWSVDGGEATRGGGGGTRKRAGSGDSWTLRDLQAPGAQSCIYLYGCNASRCGMADLFISTAREPSEKARPEHTR